MIGILQFALNIAWRVLILTAGWYLFRYVLKNGKGTIRDILETLTVMLHAAGHWVRKHCIGYLKREAEGDCAEPDIEEDVKVEATVK